MTPPRSDPPNALADLLEREHDEIVQRWKDRLRRTDTQAQRISEPALVDSVPDFLRQLAAALREQVPKTLEQPAPAAAEVAREHGGQRYRVGFDLRVVVLEYDLLREVLFEVLGESGLPVRLTDISVLTTALSIGISEAVDQYSIEREHDLRAAAAEREQASEFERQLIGIVSHDLRSPLGAIIMAADLAARIGPADLQMTRLIERIRLAGRRGARLIDDLLDFTRQRHRGSLPVRPQPVRLDRLVQATVEEVESSYPDRAIRCRVEPEVEGCWDPDRLSQVLSNLLTNAVKFSPPSSEVAVEARLADATVILEVRNEGPPIPPERLATIFEPFQRGDPATQTRASLGLGLYISRQIVLAHGGTIDVSSSSAAGTTFTVRLPLRAPDARA